MRLGLTHLLVVSGYQVSLMFGFVFSLLSYLIGIIRYGGLYMRGGVAIVAFIFAALYVSFIGAEMSSIRALIAAACVCLTVVTERVTSFAQRWGVALLFMQLIWPWCFFDIGVILTFAALLGIGLGSEFGVSSRLWSLVSVTFCVWVMTSLVVIVWQGTVSPVGLLLNLTLAAPWSIANCVVGLIGLLALLLGIPGAAYPLKLLSWINSYLAEMALIISESRYSGFELSSVSRVVIAGIMVTLAIAIIARYSASVSSRVLGMPVGKPRWI
jgi:ComEC/Rec2-related protein